LQNRLDMTHHEAFLSEHVVEFNDALDLSSMKLENDCWLIPTKWNQGCFDLMFYQSFSKVINIFQITIASKHKYKFDILKPFLKNMLDEEKATKIRYSVITKENNMIIVGKNDVSCKGKLHYLVDNLTYTDVCIYNFYTPSPLVVVRKRAVISGVATIDDYVKSKRKRI
jgi:hypothetical protein